MFFLSPVFPYLFLMLLKRVRLGRYTFLLLKPTPTSALKQMKCLWERSYGEIMGTVVGWE